MARLDPTPYDLPEPTTFRDDDPHMQAFNTLLAESNALPDGEVVGAMLRWQRGDGYAFYRVTAAEPLTVQHVPYMDAWTVEPALIRGLDYADVRQMLARERSLASLFGKSRLLGGADA